MYLVGASDQHRVDAQQLLERAIAAREKLVTSADVLQEILHRYVAIGRLDAIQPAFDALLGVVDDVVSVELGDVERAKRFVLGGAGARSARDALHLAVMAKHGITKILSFDAGFDGVPGVERVHA